MNAKEIEATEKAGYWLSLGNLAKERGDHDLAERHYERSQRWHDKMISMTERGRICDTQKAADAR